MVPPAIICLESEGVLYTVSSDVSMQVVCVFLVFAEEYWLSGRQLRQHTV